jgi:hypothetical protein
MQGTDIWESFSTITKKTKINPIFAINDNHSDGLATAMNTCFYKKLYL